MEPRAVVVGGSLAGLRAAESLRHRGHDGALTIVGEEAHRPYDRPPLSKQLLAGTVPPDAVALPVPDDLDADWHLGARATGLDLERRRVRLDSGEDVPFDRLVIATGAHPRHVRGVGPGPGVHYLRTLDDALALRAELAGARAAVVVGAGFIGLEVASSATGLGVEVTVVEALPVALERAVGPEMGALLTGLHRANGVDVRTGVAVEGVLGGRPGARPEGLRLADGSAVPADLVVVGVGVVPTDGWLAGSGVDTDDGVLCDERLRVLVGGSPHPDVVAAGDVARWWHPGYGRRVRVEHWTNAADQGDAAARTLLEGDAAPAYDPVPYVWSDQHGVKIQLVGEVRPGDDLRIVEGSIEDLRLLAAYGRHGRLVAGLGIRRPARVMALQRMIAEGAPLDAA